MERFLRLPIGERSLFFREAAARMRLSPEIIEKDFWVCWVLDTLYSRLGFTDKIIFKGGTSLSKCYNAIERFSEDVDITIDMSLFEHDIKDPLENGISGKESKRREALLDNPETIKLVQDFIITNVVRVLENKFYSTLPSGTEYSLSKKRGQGFSWSLDPVKALRTWQDKLKRKVVSPLSEYNEYVKESYMPDRIGWEFDDKDPLTLLFRYPTNAVHSDSYIQPVIRLEFGIRGGITPYESHAVKPYVRNFFPGFFDRQFCPISTLAAKRTFWEKIIILHELKYKYQPDKNKLYRQSRHYYDIYMLIIKGIVIDALDNSHLLQEIADNSLKRFGISNNLYRTIKIGLLNITPTPEMLRELEKDYKDMELMFMKEQPAFNDIIEKIKELGVTINT